MCGGTIDEYWAKCDTYRAQKSVKLSPVTASFSRGVKLGDSYSSCCRNVHLKTVFPPGTTDPCMDDPSFAELAAMMRNVSMERAASTLSGLYEKFIERSGHESIYSGMYRENWVKVMIDEEQIHLTEENQWLSRVKMAWLSMEPHEGLTWVVWLSVDPPERQIPLTDIFKWIIGDEPTAVLMSGFVGPFSIGQDRQQTLHEARTRKLRLQFDAQTALFSLSYKHYQSNSNEKITYQDWEVIVQAAEMMCKQAGLSKFYLWVDSGLDQSSGRRDIAWFTKGMLPFLWTPTILLRNRKETGLYDSVWIELEEALSAATYNYKVLSNRAAVRVMPKAQPFEWPILATLAARRILNSDNLFNAQGMAFDEIFEWSKSVLAPSVGGFPHHIEGGLTWIRPREERDSTILEDCVNIDRQMPRALVLRPRSSGLREKLRGLFYLGKYERAPALFRVYGDGSKLNGVEVLGATYQEENAYVYVRYAGVVDRIEMTRKASGEVRVTNVKRVRVDGKGPDLRKLQPLQESFLAALGMNSTIQR